MASLTACVPQFTCDIAFPPGTPITLFVEGNAEVSLVGFFEYIDDDELEDEYLDEEEADDDDFVDGEGDAVCDSISFFSFLFFLSFFY